MVGEMRFRLRKDEPQPFVRIAQSCSRMARTFQLAHACVQPRLAFHGAGKVSGRLCDAARGGHTPRMRAPRLIEWAKAYSRDPGAVPKLAWACEEACRAASSSRAEGPEKLNGFAAAPKRSRYPQVAYG